MIGTTLAHYRIERQLDEGGMGIVYVARDLKLDRLVALKLIRSDLLDPQLRERFSREARAAAALNHPNVCHLYELGEDGSTLFIAMELLEGKTLAARIQEGPLPVTESIRITLETLEALAALHRRSFVHRDVKPSNLFLTEDGRVKLLDFGLAMPLSPEMVGADGAAITTTGVIMGSSRYMAPEQIRAQRLDGRTDLFALGAVLYETLTGQPAFGGATGLESMYKVLNDPTPRLGGSPQMEAVGRVVTRALAKPMRERYPDADTMARELRDLLAGVVTSAQAVPVDRVVRLAVLPFRMLRPDPDFEFLGPGLADAVAMSLAGIHSLVVRSTLATARFAGPAPDLAQMATALDVDTVLVGTILAAPDRCRVAAQLVEAPGGRMIWSQTLDAAGKDIFQIQDTLTRRIVESLQLPLSAGEQRALGKDVPASATAYEFFLRATRFNVVGRESQVALDLYKQALEADARYAPAWAGLGRCHRLLGKYSREGRTESYRDAEEALHRALELRPALPSAQYNLAQVELDRGRVDAAIDRLLQVVERNPNDPNGYTGLVTALRYVSLLDESVVAHERARALDPQVHTSIHYTLESQGKFAAALAYSSDGLGAIHGRLLARAGRAAEAVRVLREAEDRERGNLAGALARLMRAAVEGDRDAAGQALEQLEGFPDPEGVFNHATACARLGDIDVALRMLEESVDSGYANIGAMDHDPWLADLREHPRFAALRERAAAGHRRAIDSFGPRVRAALGAEE